VVVDVCCRNEDVPALVPIVRQRVFAELAERGWGDEHVAVTPGVGGSYRRRKFRDENEASESHGRDKFGCALEFGFDMSAEMAAASFNRGSFGSIPERIS
jgi:hypothetical protein